MKRSKFYQFSPPPQFLQMPAVGLDISDAAMRFVELVETRKGFVIGRFGDFAIPRGVIESGEVKKMDALRAVFIELKKIHNLEFVSVSLPEEKAYLFELKLPLMKYNDIRGAIELVLEENVPINASDALFDYYIIKEDESYISVSVSVVARSLVEGYIEAFSDTGITPVAFEVEAHSVARSIIPEGDNGTFMTVDFGRTRTGIAIISGGVVRFTSTVQVGGGTLTDVIAKNLKVSYEDAEKIKHEQGISGKRVNEEISLAMMSTISILRDEISRHQNYWQEHTDDHGEKRPAIQKVYLCGGDSNLAGFTSYLSSGMKCPVELANTMINVNNFDEYIPEISFNDSLRYTTALGLSLRRSK